jgi:endo-1,4-beta-xylanase
MENYAEGVAFIQPGQEKQVVGIDKNKSTPELIAKPFWQELFSGVIEAQAASLEFSSEPEPTPTAEPTEIALTPEQQLTEYLQTADAKESIDQFVSAMKSAGIEITKEQVSQNLTIVDKKNDGTPFVDTNGNPYIIAAYNFDPDPTKTGELFEGSIPLAMLEKTSPPFNKINSVFFTNAGFRRGVELTGYWFNNQQWKSIVGSEFNFGVSAWGTSWAEVEPYKDTFDFNVLDTQLNFLANNKMGARGGILHPADIPDWLRNGNFSREELDQILKNHINQIVNHSRGRINEWIVVNESYISPYRTDDIFYKAFQGYDYVYLAFQYMRDADPSAKLIYNDSDNHSKYGDTTKLTRKIIAGLKEKNLIDGVGLQMHLDGASPPKKADIIETMIKYGIPVYITELDVDMRNVSGSPEEKNLIQAKIYKEVAEACLESGVCNSFTTWEIGDKFSWLEYPSENSYTSPNANPTTYTDDLQPKASLFAIEQAIFEEMKK